MTTAPEQQQSVVTPSRVKQPSERLAAVRRRQSATGKVA